MDEEMNLENNRYHPQHPLPEEIRNMERDDTVCQFCGVSYLIHNEIKSLQEKLDELQNEVERLKHYDERERVLNHQVNILNIKSGELLEKWQIEEKRNNEYEDLILQKNVYISQLKNNVENCIQNLNSVEASKENLRKQVTVTAVKISMSSKGLCEELSRTYNLYQNDVCHFMEYWNKQKAAILEKVDQFLNMHSKSEEKNKQYQSDMDCQSSRYERKIKDTDMRYENQRKILDRCSVSIMEYQKRIGLCTVQFSEFEKKYCQVSEIYCKRIVELNKRVRKLRAYLKSVGDNRSGERKIFNDSFEKYKQDNIQLKDERDRMVNAHQHQIKQLHDSFMEKLLEAEMWPGKLDEKVKDLQGRFNEEKSQLLQEYTESLNKADAESETKCKLLNESKEKCKREIKKLDEKLKMQQRKFNEEKSQLLKQVTESYEKAATDTEARYNQMNEEKENHLKTIRKLGQHLETMQVKFHGEMLKQVEQYEKEKKNTVVLFENKISELMKQLEREQHLKSNISNEEKGSLIRTIEDLQSALSNTKEVVLEKLSCIEEYKNEICSLRDCVRRECEERFELTEALAEARSELLSLQRFSNKNSPKQFASHPPIYNQKSSSVNKLHEISKSYGKPVKLEELSKSSGNLDVSKVSLGNLPTSSGSIRSQNTGRSSSISRYPKNKLKISLKNN